MEEIYCAGKTGKRKAEAVLTKTQWGYIENCEKYWKIRCHAMTEKILEVDHVMDFREFLELSARVIHGFKSTPLHE